MSSTSRLPFDLPEIFQWRNPIESGLALLSVNLIYIACLASGTGIIHLLTNYAFWFIIAAAVYLKVKSVLSGSGKSATSTDREDDYVFVSDEACQKVVIFVNDVITYFARQVQTATQPEHFSSLIKFLVGIYLAAIIGLAFSVQTLLWLSINGLFAYSFISHNEQAKQTITPLIGTATGLIKQYSQLAYSLIPRYQPAKQ